MDLSIETENVGDAVVLHVAGEVDVFTAPQLREALVGAIEEGSRDVVVDLQGVDFLDSTGLGVLVAGLKRVRQYGGDLSLVCTREHILKILDITGLVKVLKVYDSVEAATSAEGKEAEGKEAEGKEAEGKEPAG